MTGHAADVGTTPVRDSHRFDERALAAWMTAQVDGYAGPLTIEQFKGGQSNPTYRLRTPGRDYVLRRKPPGTLLKGAHDVLREARILAALEDWRTDAAVEAVMIDHAPAADGDPKGARGFCAGGDIRMLADSGAGDGAAARTFFHTEYRLNHRLFTYAKPSVAFMDGVTMGGGVGIALPCRYRVATENTKFAMPETGIGLSPDVGGGWYLSRLPGRIGPFVALTGHRLDGAEAHALGLATHYIPASALPEVKAAIAADPHGMEAILTAASVTAPHPRLLDHREDIDRLFASDTLEEVFAALEADGSAFAAEQLAVLRTKSPQAMKVSLRLLYDGSLMQSFADEMRQEYAVATHIVQRHDFLEGVRAVIVDKDNSPRWNPARPEDVTDHLIDQIFAPLSPDEAWTPN